MKLEASLLQLNRFTFKMFMTYLCLDRYHEHSGGMWICVCPEKRTDTHKTHTHTHPFPSLYKAHRCSCRNAGFWQLSPCCGDFTKAARRHGPSNTELNVNTFCKSKPFWECWPCWPPCLGLHPKVNAFCNPKPFGETQKVREATTDCEG